jgi:hypothetical protein
VPLRGSNGLKRGGLYYVHVVLRGYLNIDVDFCERIFCPTLRSFCAPLGQKDLSGIEQTANLPRNINPIMSFHHTFNLGLC